MARTTATRPFFVRLFPKILMRAMVLSPFTTAQAFTITLVSGVLISASTIRAEMALNMVVTQAEISISIKVLFSLKMAASSCPFYIKPYVAITKQARVIRFIVVAVAVLQLASVKLMLTIMMSALLVS